MYHGDSQPQDLATDAAMTALYRQLDSQDLPDDPDFDTEAGLRDLTSRIARRELAQPAAAAKITADAAKKRWSDGEGLHEPPEPTKGQAVNTMTFSVSKGRLAEFGMTRPGGETLKKGTRVTGVDRSKLATTLGKRYDSGESIRSLAASTGRSYGFVHRILTQMGVTLRGRGGATRSRKAKR